MSLRMLEVYHPDTDKDIEDILDDISLIDVRKHKEMENASRIVIPSESTDSAVEVLENSFEDSDNFRINIFPVEASVPQPEKGVMEEGKEESERVGIDEIYQKLMESSSVSRTFIVLMVLASIVASIGFIHNDVAVIIGSMVIAPFIQPNMALSLATTLADRELAIRSSKTVLLGVAIPILVGVVFGTIFSIDPQSSQIISRTNITLMYVLLALSSGVAGALSTTKGVSQSLVGVMVAVALLPPLVVTGLLVGSGMFLLAIGSTILFCVNIVGINLSGVLTFLVQDIRPRNWWEKEKSSGMIKRAVFVWVVLLSILIVLIQLYRVFIFV